MEHMKCISQNDQRLPDFYFFAKTRTKNRICQLRDVFEALCDVDL